MTTARFSRSAPPGSLRAAPAALALASQLEILALRAFAGIARAMIPHREVLLQLPRWCLLALLLGGVVGFLLRVALAP